MGKVEKWILYLILSKKLINLYKFIKNYAKNLRKQKRNRTSWDLSSTFGRFLDKTGKNRASRDRMRRKRRRDNVHSSNWLYKKWQKRIKRFDFQRKKNILVSSHRERHRHSTDGENRNSIKWYTYILRPQGIGWKSHTLWLPLLLHSLSLHSTQWVSIRRQSSHNFHTMEKYSERKNQISIRMNSSMLYLEQNMKKNP